MFRLFLVLPVTALLAGCGGDPPPSVADPEVEAATPSTVVLTATQRDNASLATAAVRRQTPTREIVLTGTVGYDETATARIAPRIAGRILRIVADLGDRVAAGDVLAVLDSPELGEAQAAYLARLAEFRVARRAHGRAETLFERKAIAEGELLQREGALRRAEAELGLAENRLHLYDMSDEEISRLGQVADGGEQPLHGAVSPELVLRSPIAGTVTRREVSVGQVVDRLQTLYVVSDLGRVWAWLDTYERDLGAITTGTPVAITSESLPTAALAGRIDFIGEVEPETRAARVRARIGNPDLRLRPGMFIRAQLAVGAGGEVALAVPREAIQELDGRTVVFRVVQGDTFEAVTVRLGRTFDGSVEVIDGLAEGDEIVTAGAFTLKGELLRGELAEED